MTSDVRSVPPAVEPARRDVSLFHASDTPHGLCDDPTSPVPAGLSSSGPTYSLRNRLLAYDAIGVTAGWAGLTPFFDADRSPTAALTWTVIGIFGTLVAFRAAGLYRSRCCARRGQQVLRTILSAVAGTAAALGVPRLIGQSPPVELLWCGLTTGFLTSFLRVHYERWLCVQRAQGRHLRNVVVVGNDEDTGELVRMLNSEPELGYRVAAIVCPGQRGAGPAPDEPDVIADLPRRAGEAGSSGVIFAANALGRRDLQRALAICASAGLHIQVWPGITGVGSPRLRPVPLSGEPFYYVETHHAYRWQLVTKRALDIGGAALALVVAIPLLAVAAIAVKLDQPGPVIYRQRRVGLNGRAFTVYKFRTMAEGADIMAPELRRSNQRTDGPLYKNERDPRVTRIGRLLRPLSIDELPQLWNVLVGSMSLVGPRPALPSEVEEFDAELQRRHTMRPGITGLWQARARENPSFHAYRRLDLYYIDNWSLRLDLSILAVTLPNILAQAVRSLRWRRRSDTRELGSAVLRVVADFPNIGDEVPSASGENLGGRELGPA